MKSNHCDVCGSGNSENDNCYGSLCCSIREEKLNAKLKKLRRFRAAYSRTMEIQRELLRELKNVSLEKELDLLLVLQATCESSEARYQKVLKENGQAGGQSAKTKKRKTKPIEIPSSWRLITEDDNEDWVCELRAFPNCGKNAVCRPKNFTRTQGACRKHALMAAKTGDWK